MLNERLEKDLEVALKSMEISGVKSEILRSYMITKKEGAPELLILDMFWGRELEEMLEYLKDAGVNNFIIEREGMASINTLSYLMNNGCKIVAASERKTENWAGKDKIVKGLVISIV